MKYPEIKVLPRNEKLTGLARMLRDIPFACPDGVELKMQILAPWYGLVDDTTADMTPKPCIVFLQGSAWTTPDQDFEIPQLGWYAQHGYVVATITHRDRTQGHPAPAFLQDAKTAVRFLRKNAAQYGIDPDRIGFWGTSSGGNTAMLMAVTANDPRYRTTDYAEYSDDVKAVVECFGPSDMRTLVDFHLAAGNSDIPSMIETFAGCGITQAQQDALALEMSPRQRIAANANCPPMLLIHGSADPLVDYSESETFYHKYIDAGYDARMICIEGAPHEGSFWSWALHEEILAFFDEKL